MEGKVKCKAVSADTFIIEVVVERPSIEIQTDVPRLSL